VVSFLLRVLSEVGLRQLVLRLVVRLLVGLRHLLHLLRLLDRLVVLRLEVVGVVLLLRLVVLRREVVLVVLVLLLVQVVHEPQQLLLAAIAWVSCSMTSA
jgi:hypothetical protein